MYTVIELEDNGQDFLELITDENGTVNFEFFNADGKGTYRAVVEGFDKNGNIGRVVYRYTVK